LTINVPALMRAPTMPSKASSITIFMAPIVTSSRACVMPLTVLALIA
jgi:hypothetical protein